MKTQISCYPASDLPEKSALLPENPRLLPENSPLLPENSPLPLPLLSWWRTLLQAVTIS